MSLEFIIFCMIEILYLYIQRNYITIEILILNQWNLKYNRIDMKNKISQKILRPSRKIYSSTKQLPLPSTAPDSLKAPKKKPTRKNRKFGDDITNEQKQPVFQSMQVEEIGCSKSQVQNKMSQIEPYLFQINSHIKFLDEKFNESVLIKLSQKTSDSTEITLDMRKILIKWIMQVGEKFRACPETLHICVQIIDYTLVFSQKKITKSNFQLLGISALFVASKYNEIYTPQAKKYIYVCDGLYKLEDLFQMQSYILTLTQFNLQFPTVYSFYEKIVNDQTLTEDFRKTIDNLSKIIVMDFNLFNRYKKLDLHGVIIYLSAKICSTEQFTSKQIMQQLEIDSQTFKNCFSSLLTLYKQTHRQVSPNPQSKNQ